MRAVLWLSAAVLYGFILLPVAVLVLYSFQDGRLPVPPFTGPTLRWYAGVFADGRLTAALVNSLLVALASSAVACLLGFLAACGLAHVRLPWAAALRGLLMAPIAVSYLIIGLGLLISLTFTGGGKSLVAVGIGHAVINTPLCFAIVAASIGPAQRAAERAARDLGASEAAVMAFVTAPMVAPGLAAAFALSVTFSWDEFVIAFLLSRFEVTVPVEIWSLLRSGLSPKTNAVGSVVFLASALVVLAVELALFRRRP